MQMYCFVPGGGTGNAGIITRASTYSSVIAVIGEETTLSQLFEVIC